MSASSNFKIEGTIDPGEKELKVLSVILNLLAADEIPVCQIKWGKT